ncbi:MAG: hypothetical protein JWP92_1990 [Caulobacter sp.]|nr:hypothetical protein [Caulobacter sp.]
MPIADTQPGPVLNETRARQGRRGRHVFWVLVISTVLAAIALFGAWAFRSGDLARTEPNVGVKNAAEAQRYDTQQVPARQNTAPPASQ